MGKKIDYRISAVKNFSQPQTIDIVWSLLGVRGCYRLFMNGFTKIASLLTQLLKNSL